MNGGAARAGGWSERMGLDPGALLMVATMAVFAAQDGVSKLLARDYHPLFFVTVRYWAFALFVLALLSRRPGGLSAATRSARPFFQISRGLLLVVEILVMMIAFDRLGLAETHAIFASYPLILTALSPLVLGERVGAIRWAAVGIGFVGVVLILAPGGGVWNPDAAWAVASAFLMAAYGAATRYAGRDDPAEVSVFYTAVSGAAALSIIGPFYFAAAPLIDWAWMGALCITGSLGHYLLIRAYATSEASALQPYAYLQLVFASAIGVIFFGEALRPELVIGAAIVVAAGLVVALRERRRRLSAIDAGPS